MAKDKKGKGSGTKDACYHKVKSRYSVWPSAYASGALVKCRKVGASNWGNKSESFEIDPKKHKAAQKNQKIRNMTKSPNENEAKVAAKKAKGPELPMEQYTAAVDFFMNEGINEDGVEIFIEELGLESFVEFVCDLSEEVLTEAKFDRIPPVTKTGKKISDLKGGPKASSIKSKRKIRATLRQKVDDESKSKPGFASFSKKASEVTSKSKKDNASKAAASAKKQQPEKKPVRDAIARGVFRAVDAYKKGMERHRAAMDTAKKAGKVVGAIAKEVPTGVKMAGKATKAAYKVATKEEVEISEAPFQVFDMRDKVNVGKEMKNKKRARTKAGKLDQEYGAYRYKVIPTGDDRPEVKYGTKKVEEGYKPIDKKKENEMYRRAGNLARTSLASKGKKKLETAKKSATIVSAISRQKENERFANMADEKARSNYSESRDPLVQKILDEAGKKCWKGYKKAGTQTLFGKTYNSCVKA